MTMTAKKSEVETITKLHARDLQSAEVSQASKIKPTNAGVQNGTSEDKSEGKSKAELRAKRRAKQEARRAAKQQQQQRKRKLRNLLSHV